MRATIALAAAATGLLAACSSSSSPGIVVSGTAPRAPYAGALYLPVGDHDETAPVLERSGAAGRALECSGTPFDGATGASGYPDGPDEVSPSAVAALTRWNITTGGPEYRPASGYRVERSSGGRVLFSWDVSGRTKVAVIASKHMADNQRRTGWGIETWAQCDPAELPATVTDDLGLGIWTDADGHRVPIAKAVSFPGKTWCDIDSTRLMTVGGAGRGHDYVYASGTQLDDYTVVPAARLDAVPAGAVDTGYQRDGRALWTSPDRRAVYLVATRDAHDVQRWAQLDPGTGCG